MSEDEDAFQSAVEENKQLRAELRAAVDMLRRISRGYVNPVEFRAIVAAYDAKHGEGK